MTNAKRENYIIGRNAVIEAINSKRTIEKIFVKKNGHGSLREIIGKAKGEGIKVEVVEKNILDKMAKENADIDSLANINHQGIIAKVAPYRYKTFEDIEKKALEKGEAPFVILLDGIEDPHNLGAIMRTAECAGAHGVVIPKNRAVGITGTVVKSAAGAVEYMPCVEVVNLSRTIEQLQKKGYWIVAADMDGEVYYEMDMPEKIGIVIGAEGKGVSRLVKEKSDFFVSVPIKGKINSLNASNAAAVIMYEVRRQRSLKIK